MLFIILLNVLLFGTCLLGDLVGGFGFVSRRLLLRAVVDNATHALIGALCWAIVLLGPFISKTYLWSRVPTHFIAEIAGCALIASLVDLDHFIAAKSLHLSDAIHLSHRPLLHCTTIPVVIFMVSSATSLYFLRASYIPRMISLIFVAFLSHHFRDAARRGLWLPPISNALPVPYFSYPWLIIILANLFRHYYMLSTPQTSPPLDERSTKGMIHVI